MTKVFVDKDLCIGCGSCVAIAPDNFEFDDDGLAKAIKEEINDDVKTAAESCPTDAINIEKEN
ncbi:MAG: ferredoxin [Bacilli bacterium]|nr:ferredoxin [Bacilli bacterium]